MEEVCAKHEALAVQSQDSAAAAAAAASGHGGGGAAADHHGDTTPLNLTGEMLHEYLADLATPCDQMLLRCHFEGRWVEYSLNLWAFPFLTFLASQENSFCPMDPIQ